MWAMLEQRMLARLRADPAIRSGVKKIEAAVADGRITPALAAEQIAEMLVVKATRQHECVIVTESGTSVLATTGERRASLLTRFMTKN